jgi:hypothetical protein
MLPIINRLLLSFLTLLLPMTNSMAAEQTYLLTKARVGCISKASCTFATKAKKSPAILS